MWSLDHKYQLELNVYYITAFTRNLTILVKDIDISYRILIFFGFGDLYAFESIYFYCIRLWNLVCILAIISLFFSQFTIVTRNENSENKRKKLKNFENWPQWANLT